VVNISFEWAGTRFNKLYLVRGLTWRALEVEFFARPSRIVYSLDICYTVHFRISKFIKRPHIFCYPSQKHLLTRSSLIWDSSL